MNDQMRTMEKNLHDIRSNISLSDRQTTSTDESQLENHRNGDEETDVLAENIDTLTRVIEGTTTAFQFAAILFKK